MGIEWWPGLGQTQRLALVGSILLACGGHLSRDAQEMGAAGGSGMQGGTSSAGTEASGASGASAGSASSGSRDEPSTATLLSPAGDAEAEATPAAIGPCFRGFTAVIGGVHLEFAAFVQSPGDYQGDALHILYLAARLPDGRTFSASTNSAPYGKLDLHVSAVSPRFVGSVKGVLYDRAAQDAPPLTLSLAFDVVAESGTCDVPTQ